MNQNLPWWSVTVIDDYICADGEPDAIERQHTYLAQAATKDEAVKKFRDMHDLTSPDLEYCVQGPFDTCEQAQRDS